MSFNPIPDGMPLDRAADLMVRRGECSSFFLARARIARARNRKSFGRTETTPATHAETKKSFNITLPANYRLPYKDE